MDKEYRS